MRAEFEKDMKIDSFKSDIFRFPCLPRVFMECTGAGALKIRPQGQSTAMSKKGTAAGAATDVNTALQDMLRTSLLHGGLACGTREAARAFDKRPAHLSVLACNCDEPMYVSWRRRSALSTST